MVEEFDAIGSGAEFALGAVKALHRTAPMIRVRRALEIAAHFNMGVCGPFTIKTI